MPVVSPSMLFDIVSPPLNIGMPLNAHCSLQISVLVKFFFLFLIKFFETVTFFLLK